MMGLEQFGVDNWILSKYRVIFDKDFVDCCFAMYINQTSKPLANVG
jgi:hypothetical protein